MSSYIKYNNQYYILADTSLADNSTMVLKDGDTFGVFDRYGDIHPIGMGAQGVYRGNTRHLSKMELRIENKQALFLSSGPDSDNDILIADLANPNIGINGNSIEEKGSVHIQRTKFLVSEVYYESIRLFNYGMEGFPFSLQLTFNADFKDLFEIRGIERKMRGKKLQDLVSENEICLSYKGLDNTLRKTRINLHPIPDSIHKIEEDQQIVYKLNLNSREEYTIFFSVSFEGGADKPITLGFQEAFKEACSLSKIRKDAFDILTDNEDFNNWVNRSKVDLNMMITKTELGPYPYAGVPWYSNPFGRDGIITAWQCLWIDPGLVKGVLIYLAKTQAKEFSDFYDAEPGKIFHEKREGEMVNLGEVPFKMYYGTIDATPLFIGLAGAYYERTGDIETIRTIWPNIEMALAWIDNYGDLDGDGFVEYLKKSERGLANQGWKDSYDSVFYENGELAKGAIALCEVQGYVYDAKVKAAMLAKELGYQNKADQLYKESEVLKEKFSREFWSETKKTFVLALDGEKQPCNIVSSNAGHCLFSGIAQPEHAEKVAEVLLDEKMYSGWGVRTIAVEEKRYNPMSYHNGSVWPHDNAIIAYGLSQYGHKDGVLKIFEGIFGAAQFMEKQRLPELYCGFSKKTQQGPTAYPVACSPQSWAVGSVFMLMQALLGLRIIAKEKIIYLHNPVLPETLHELVINNLSVGDLQVTLKVRQDPGKELTAKVDQNVSEVKVKIVNNQKIIN